MSDAGATAEIGSVDELSPDQRGALRDLILCLADSKRILGIRYADWVLGAPELEASIAASSIAQDEWGHSRTLYALLKDFGDDPNAIEHEREASQYRNLEALDEALATWPEFVVANAVIDTAITTQLQALTECRYSALQQRVRKQIDEERFHFGHGSAWLRRLAKAGDKSKSALKSALGSRWPGVIRWFGPGDQDATLVDGGFASAIGPELRGRFVERVGPLFEESGLEPPSVEVDLDGWDPASRRVSRDGPDRDAVERARGDRNRAFLMD